MFSGLAAILNAMLLPAVII